jgi:hypothetical protein
MSKRHGRGGGAGGSDVGDVSGEAADPEAGPLVTTKIHRRDLLTMQKIASLRGLGSVAKVVAEGDFQRFLTYLLLEELRKEGERLRGRT